jgi:hypothetical protein
MAFLLFFLASRPFFPLRSRRQVFILFPPVSHLPFFIDYTTTPLPHRRWKTGHEKKEKRPGTSLRDAERKKINGNQRNAITRHTSA